MKGFTLIELLIVITLSIIITAVTIPIYGNLQVSSQLNENTSQIIQAIRTARQQSVAGLNNSPHGVKFLADRYILYQGTSYALRDSAYDREAVLNGPLGLASTLTNDDVVFSRGLGVPDNTGSIVLTHVVNGQRTIEINGFGAVNEN